VASQGLGGTKVEVFRLPGHRPILHPKKKTGGHSSLAISTAASGRVLVELVAGLALCYGGSDKLTLLMIFSKEIRTSYVLRSMALFARFLLRRTRFFFALHAIFLRAGKHRNSQKNLASNKIRLHSIIYLKIKKPPRTHEPRDVPRWGALS
jgi:hypothetical protein